MNDRQNSIVCVFDPKSPCVTAYQIHEWIFERLRIPEQEVRMIQIDGPQWRVYIKLATSEQAYAILQTTSGQMEYKHDNGELSTVQVELAGMGTRRIRIANLPPEITDSTIWDALSIYGEVKEV